MARIHMSIAPVKSIQLGSGDQNGEVLYPSENHRVIKVRLIVEANKKIP